jgi:hypothetical protein
VRRDKLNERVKEVSLADGFTASKYRESRDEQGRLTYLSGSARLAKLKGMPIFNVAAGEMAK